VLRLDQGAEGVEGEGFPPPHPTRSLGKHRKLLQRGPGQSPGRKWILVHFEAKTI